MIPKIDFNEFQEAERQAKRDRLDSVKIIASFRRDKKLAEKKAWNAKLDKIYDDFMKNTGMDKDAFQVRK